MADRHERRVLLVPCLHELDVIRCSAQGAHERVDPVTAVAEDPGDAPGPQPFDDQVRHQLAAHRTSSAGLCRSTRLSFQVPVEGIRQAPVGGTSRMEKMNQPGHGASREVGDGRQLAT